MHFCFFLYVVINCPGTAKSLCKKYKAAVEGVKVMKVAFADIDEQIKDSQKKAEWRLAEEKAMTDRGKALDIFNVRVDHGGNAPR